MTLAAELAAMAAIERIREQADQHFGALDKPMDEWGSKEIAQMNYQTAAKAMAEDVITPSLPSREVRRQEWALPLPGIRFGLAVAVCVVLICWGLV